MTNHKQNWLDVFAGFRVAFGARKIILGTVGFLISVIVILGLLWLAGEWYPTARETVAKLLRDPFGPVKLFSEEMSAATTWSARVKVVSLRILDVQRFVASMDARQAALVGGGVILLLFIWSYLGGAVARLAAVDFAREERLPIGEATAFAARKFGSFFWSPLVPLIFVVILLLCNVFLGVIGRIPVVGPILMGVGAPLAAISAFLALLLVIGTVVGFPFMWPTIAMEGTDAFDAISRAFNYLFARPWKTFWCWLMAAVYGIVVIAFVGAFTCALLAIVNATIARGMGADWVSIEQFMREGIADRNAGLPLLIAMVLICIVHVLAWGLVFGFIASYKISAMTIIYSVLRRDVDGTDMSEVFLPEPEETITPEPPAATPSAGEQKPAQ